MAGSESEGELVGGEVTEESCLGFILSSRNHLELQVGEDDGICIWKSAPF